MSIHFNQKITMTDILEEDDNDKYYDDGYEMFLERTLHSMFIGMEALEEVCDKLRAENRHLKSIVEMGAKKVH